MSSEIKEKLLAGLKTRPLLALAVAQAYRFVLALRADFFLCFKFRHTFLASDVRLMGISRIHLGRNVVIGSQCLLNVNERGSTSVALSIGENTFIGIRNMFNVGHSIILREYCLTAMNCAFIGSAHRYDNPMSAYLSAGVTSDTDIYVGANCFFGYGSQVLGNVRIGHGCVIGAGAVVRKDIPPFSLVVGNPARIIKRFDFTINQWVPWPCKTLTEGPAEEQYVEHLRRQHGYVLQPISAAASCWGNVL